MPKKEEPLHITVKKLLIDRQLRQKDLARTFNRDKSAISKALSGERKQLLVKIAKYLGLQSKKR